MLLIIEIILTINAWKKGWGAKALLPLGLCFFIGLILGLSGAITRHNLGSLFILDLINIVALGLMIAKAPQRTTKISQTPEIEKRISEKNSSSIDS